VFGCVQQPSVPADRRWCIGINRAKPALLIDQLGLGYVAIIAGYVSDDTIVEENPDNGRWISNIVTFLVDEVSRGRERSGAFNSLQAPRTLRHAEWAAELGRLAELHNDVEKRLRDLVQRVLQDEEQRRGDSGWAGRAIMASMPDPMRAGVTSDSTEQLLASLYWLNLVAIVGKQWRLFERIFGSREELTGKAQIVNDRPHAHAKQLDAADVALYRRELRWFKDKLDRSAASLQWSSAGSEGKPHPFMSQ
jgi:hypothetical protein